MNETLVPLMHPNVAHVLDISEALVLATHPNAPYFPIYPRVSPPGVRHLGAASELHYIYGSPKSTTCLIHGPHHKHVYGSTLAIFVPYIRAILWLIYEPYISSRDLAIYWQYLKFLRRYDHFCLFLVMFTLKLEFKKWSDFHQSVTRVRRTFFLHGYICFHK